MTRPVLLLVAALLATPAVARVTDRAPDDGVPLQVTADSLPEQRAAVLAAFEPGEHFAELDAQGRAAVIEGLDRMQAILGSATSIDQLDAEAKVELFNEQALVNEVLTQAQRDSRLTCKRNRTVNSRISNTECHTAAEWERRRERARKLMDMNKRSVSCPSDSNGSFAACQ